MFPTKVLFKGLQLTITLRYTYVNHGFPEVYSISIPQQFVIRQFLPRFSKNKVPRLSYQRFLSIVYSVHNVAIRTLRDTNRPFDISLAR